jgi:nucleoside-diphosphate-sugar epimerase
MREVVVVTRQSPPLLRTARVERVDRLGDGADSIQGQLARDYHNVYGPYGTWDGGREKAPAAVSRKVAMAILSGKHEIEIWGDGEQTRSFMYIDDCLHGSQRLLHSDVEKPLNIGSDEMVTINQLVDIVEDIAGVKLKRKYDLDAPKGVRGRNSDNTLAKLASGGRLSQSLDPMCRAHPS